MMILTKKKSEYIRKCPQPLPLQPKVAEKPKLSERKYNCNECDFQGIREIELNNHINLKHRKEDKIRMKK